MVAGTIVVIAPQARLLPDLGASVMERQAEDVTEFAFTPRQLEVYGVYELQVLEDLLRKQRRDRRDAIRTVADRIAKKIEWPERIPEAKARVFLQEYYTALRAYQEKRLLFGRRKEDKHAKPQ